MITRRLVDESKLNPAPVLPFNLRTLDFQSAMQDAYDFLYDVNSHLLDRNLPRLDEMLRPAIMSGTLSDLLTESMAKHSRSLVVNAFFNGHPDLIVKGKFPDNSVKAGHADGVEIKATRKAGGAVDTHGARDQWLAVFVYKIDDQTQPAVDREPLRFTEVYCAHVGVDDFRRNERGELGTPTATLDKEGVQILRRGWVYLDTE